MIRRAVVPLTEMWYEHFVLFWNNAREYRILRDTSRDIEVMFYVGCGTGRRDALTWMDERSMERKLPMSIGSRFCKAMTGRWGLGHIRYMRQLTGWPDARLSRVVSFQKRWNVSMIVFGFGAHSWRGRYSCRTNLFLRGISVIVIVVSEQGSENWYMRMRRPSQTKHLQSWLLSMR